MITLQSLRWAVDSSIRSSSPHTEEQLTSCSHPGELKLIQRNARWNQEGAVFISWQTGCPVMEACCCLFLRDDFITADSNLQLQVPHQDPSLWTNGSLFLPLSAGFPLYQMTSPHISTCGHGPPDQVKACTCLWAWLMVSDWWTPCEALFKAHRPQQTGDRLRSSAAVCKTLIHEWTDEVMMISTAFNNTFLFHSQTPLRLNMPMCWLGCGFGSLCSEVNSVCGFFFHRNSTWNHCRVQHKHNKIRKPKGTGRSA